MVSWAPHPRTPCGSQPVVPRTAASASAGNLWNIQILKSQSRLPDALELEPSNLFITPTRWFWCMLNFNNFILWIPFSGPLKKPTINECDTVYSKRIHTEWSIMVLFVGFHKLSNPLSLEVTSSISAIQFTISKFLSCIVVGINVLWGILQPSWVFFLL